MKCPACKKEDTISGSVSVTRVCRLVKGGGLDFAGVAMKQSDMKAAWEASKKTVPGTATDQKYNEVHCTGCLKLFWYVDGQGLVGENWSGAAATTETPETPAAEGDAAG